MEPGYFRTKVFGNITPIPPRVQEFADFHAVVKAGAEAISGTEPGDPEKAVTRIVELVRGTGMAEGRNVPLRVALGSDGWERIRYKCETVLKGCQEWEEVARSTDFEAGAK